MLFKALICLAYSWAGVTNGDICLLDCLIICVQLAAGYNLDDVDCGQ